MSRLTKSIARYSPSLFVGHVINDMSTNSLPGLLPIIAPLFGLSYLLAGTLGTVLLATSSILQPVLGRWFDRTQLNWILGAGLILNCVSIGLIGIVPNYAVLLTLVALAGLGSAAFHPPAFSRVARSNASSKGRAMGVFVSAGNVGVFLGPIITGLVISTLSLQGMLLFLPIGFATAWLVLRIEFRTKQKATSTDQGRFTDRRLLSILGTITASRAFAIDSAIAFMPLYLVAKGMSLLAATSIASVWLAAGVLGQVSGGFFSGSARRRSLMFTTHVLAAGAFYGFLTSSGFLSLLLLTVSGAAIFVGWPVIVTMSSEAAPDAVGVVTGLILGVSQGIGGLSVLAFGALADRFGLAFAFRLVVIFALTAGLLSLAIPRGIKQSR